MDGLYYIVYFTIIDILRTFTSPFFILIIAIIFSQYYNKVNDPIIGTINSIFFGTIGGIIGTIIFIYLEVYIIPKDFIYIFIIAIILSLIDTRFICFAYGGSIVALINLLFGYPDIDNNKFMLIISVLHLIESILILINGIGQKQKDVFNIDSQLYHGYSFIRFWPLPLVIFIGDTIIRPVTLLAILNYADFTLSNSAKIKTVLTATLVALYSIILFIITNLEINPFLPPIFAILGHEFILYINLFIEKRRFNL